MDIERGVKLDRVTLARVQVQMMEHAPQRNLVTLRMRTQKIHIHRDTDRNSKTYLSDSPPNPGDACPIPSLTCLALWANLPIPESIAKRRYGGRLLPFPFFVSIGYTFGRLLKLIPLCHDPWLPRSDVAL